MFTNKNIGIGLEGRFEQVAKSGNDNNFT